MQKDEYNFIYNDGDYQILEEEVLSRTKDEERELRKYYAVHKNYKHIASFKDKKESLLWVGWKNKLDMIEKEKNGIN